MYDGTCSFRMPYHYADTLRAMGIQCRVFNQIEPVLSTVQNNRDHRKITVIDGHTAFTGGINLEDAYINAEVRYGYWKDTAVLLEGEAVRSFTSMFLQASSRAAAIPTMPGGNGGDRRVPLLSQAG